MTTAIDELLNSPAIWRIGGQQRNTGHEHVATGFAELDAALPGGGWPLGALAEVLHGSPGIGELRLLMPALRQLIGQGRWLAMIAPPYVPYAPALASLGIDLSRLLVVYPSDRTASLWAVEQALRAGTCGAVLAWPRRIDERSLRRLQLAAETGNTLGLLFREEASATTASPAALRLWLGHDRVELIKCRGKAGGEPLHLDLAEAASGIQPSPEVQAEPLQHRPTPTSSAASPAAGTKPRGQRPRGRSRSAQLDLPLTATQGACSTSSNHEPEQQAAASPGLSGARH